MKSDGLLYCIILLGMNVHYIESVKKYATGIFYKSVYLNWQNLDVHSETRVWYEESCEIISHRKLPSYGAVIIFFNV